MSASQDADIPEADGLGQSEIEKVKEELLDHVSSQEKVQPYRPQWQEDYHDIRMKSSEEVARNMRLSIDQRMLQDRIKELTLQKKSQEDLYRSLQSQITEYQENTDENQWKLKLDKEAKILNKVLEAKHEQLNQIKEQIRLQEDKIAVSRLKLQLLGVDDQSPKLMALQEERNLLEAQIISQEEKEKELIANIRSIRDKGLRLDPTVAHLKSEIDQLHLQLKDLEDKQKSLSGKSGPSPQEEVELLVKQKADLTIANEQLKAKIEKYKKSERMGIKNKRMKDLIDTISAVDAANEELNEEITNLTENIIILKMRIAKMEYRAESMKAIKENRKEMVR